MATQDKPPPCPRCGSNRRFTTTPTKGKPHFKCRKCGKFYSQSSGTDLRYSKLKPEVINAIFDYFDNNPTAGTGEARVALGMNWTPVRRFHEIWSKRTGIPIPKPWTRGRTTKVARSVTKHLTKHPDTTVNKLAKMFQIQWLTARRLKREWEAGLSPTRSHPSPPDAPEPASRKRKQEPSP